MGNNTEKNDATQEDVTLNDLVYGYLAGNAKIGKILRLSKPVLF